MATFIGNVETASTTTLSTGVWHHVAVVKTGATGNNVQLYINGAADGGPAARTIETFAGGLRIGAHKSPFSTNKSWNGQIDDARIYNRALLPWEILMISNWIE